MASSLAQAFFGHSLKKTQGEKKIKLKLKKLKTQEIFAQKLKIPAIFSEIQEDF